jgi:hypothetical protein
MRDEIEERILEDVKQCGWHLIIVPDDEEGPGFVYSVGMMHTLKHPEIIMFGLETDLMVDVINGMGEQIRQGQRYAEAGLAEGFLKGHACRMVPVAKHWHAEYMRYAMWHHHHTGQSGAFAAVQCVWPDKRGRFPDDPRCSADVVEAQPLLDK